MDLKNADAQLKEDENVVRKYLLIKGVQEDEMIFSSIVIVKEFNSPVDANGRSLGQPFSGFNLTQNVRIESPNVDTINAISGVATELIRQGIEFNPVPPFFYYTKLSQVKMDLLAKASADGKKRAEIIASNSGSSLGKLKKASPGVFQSPEKHR